MNCFFFQDSSKTKQRRRYRFVAETWSNDWHRTNHRTRNLRFENCPKTFSNSFLFSSDFPNENLSDNDSDRDLSSPIHSLSINDLSSRSSKERSIVTTNSVPQSLTNLVPENSIAFLLTDSSNSRPSNNENESIQSTSIDQEQQRSINQSKRIGKNLTVQLLADRTRMHPSSSDSSLNVIPNF